MTVLLNQRDAHLLMNEMHNTQWNLLSHTECNYVICGKIDGAGDYHVKSNKPDSEKQIIMDFGS